MSRVVIAGGGISGLAIAWAIRRREPRAEVLLFERSARTGGNIHTQHVDGYICESGPDGFLDDAPETLQLVHAVGLEPRLLPSNDAARKRYIFLNGTLWEVPTSPRAFLRTPLLTTRGKLRVACEPLAPRRVDPDESIFDFAARRIGREAASVFVDSMVSGIFAGDSHALSLQACFPKMRRLEDEHGGLFRALVATRRTRRKGNALGAPSGKLTSFTGGLSDLIDRLTRQLNDVVRTSCPVVQLRKRGELHGFRSGWPPPSYSLVTGHGQIDADAVVLAGPSADSAALLQSVDPVLASALEQIPSAPLAVVCLGYDQADLARRASIDGFGFLVPRGQNIRMLGALWESSIYPNRAPSGKVLLRVMIGGACDPEAVTLDDHSLVSHVRHDLARTMGLTRPPEFTRIIRHRRGIPQYVTGHLERVRRIEALLTRHPGLFLAGNSYRGVSLNACVSEADQIAERVLRLAAESPAA
jgi:protoporphyrinogen/coproporphyrinogen III oxidase